MCLKNHCGLQSAVNSFIALCWASTHGLSQLKRQILRVAGYMKTVLKWFNYPCTRGNYTEIVLKWFNYPCARAHPGCDVSCQGTESTCIIGSLCFIEASLTVEKAVLCYKADQLVALLLSFLTFSRCLQYVNFVLQGMNAVNEATDGCMQTFDA